MRKMKFIKRGQLPQRIGRKKNTAYQSVIPPRDLKYWFVVVLLLAGMGGLVYVLLKISDLD